MAKRKRCICTIFDNIEIACDIILKMKIRHYATPEELKDDIDRLIEDIIASSQEGKERGQAMENRLSDYRNAIEDLGFVRDKNDTIKDEITALKEKIFELTNAKQEDHNE
jgi:polyhydroxyalkanoate synthesis regulator phasin